MCYSITGKSWLSQMFTARQGKTWPKKLAMGVPCKIFKLGLISIKPPISLRCCVQSLSELELLKSGESAETCKNMLPPGKLGSGNPSPSSIYEEPPQNWKAAFKHLQTVEKVDLTLTSCVLISGKNSDSPWHCMWTGPYHGTIPSLLV